MAGVKVLDFTQMVAGPYCTMLLGDMGADVVKVERPPGGDEMRSIDPHPGRSPRDQDQFYAVNRGKRSLVVNLKDEAGRSLMRRLAAQADVVVQNFAPGTAEKLGIGYATLAEVNPRLVYCAISGFGQDGPLVKRRAVDGIIQAMAGVLSVTGDPDGAGMPMGAPISDVVAGMFAAYAIAAGLLEVRRTGVGRFFDIAMLDSMLNVLAPVLSEALATRRVPTRFGRENPWRVPSSIYAAGDGRMICLTVPNQAFWPGFCRALHKPEWVDDLRFCDMAARLENRRLLNSLISAEFARGPSADWIERLEEEHVPCGPVHDLATVWDDPAVLHRQLVMEFDHPESGTIRVVGPPWRVTGSTWDVLPPPLLGQHTHEVVADWLRRDPEATPDLAGHRSDGPPRPPHRR